MATRPSKWWRDKSVLAVWTGLALSSLFCAQGCGHTRDHRTNLIVWGVTLGPNDKGQADVFREFERQNPDIHVQTLMMGSGGMNPQKLMTAIVGKVPPDVVYQDRFTLADWAARGAFEPLDPLIARDQGRDPRTPTADQYYPETWDEASYKGKVYGIPWMADDRIFVWNRALFREKARALRSAGLDPDRAPRTWSELLAYSRVLTEKNPDGTLKRAGFIPNFGNAWFAMYATLNDARLLSPDGKACTLDSSAAREALEFMKKCYDVLGGAENADRYQSTFRGEGNDAFFTGQVAMKIDGDWALGGIARYAPRLDFGSGPPPVPDDRFHRRGRFQDVASVWTSWTGGYAYCIPHGARHQEAAWKFIKWVTSYEARMLEGRQQDALNRTRGQMTFPRLTAQVRATDQSLKDFMPKNPALAEAVKWHFRLLPVSKVRPVSFAGKVLWDEENTAADRALHGKATVDAALATASQNVQRILDEVNDEDRYPVANLAPATATGLLGVVLGGVLLIARKHSGGLGKLGRKEALWGYLFVAPWVVGFLVLTAGPMVVSMVLAFTQSNVLEPSRWVGWKNFNEVAVQDRAVLIQSFTNAFYIAGIGVPLGLVTGLSVALLLNAVRRGAALFRTLYYLPAVVPGIATVVLWMWILSPDPRMGLANAAWNVTVGPWFDIPSPGWLSSEAWAKPALILMGLWGAGSGFIVWLAGLKGVPNELYEAAQIDGARPAQQFWSVTLPQLSPLVFFNAATGFIGAIQIFDPVYVAANVPGTVASDRLTVPVYQLFTNAFGYFRMGYASALAWIIFLVILAVTGVQFLLARRFVHYEVDS